jgi:hypothetical protein
MVDTFHILYRADVAPVNRPAQASKRRDAATSSRGPGDCILLFVAKDAKLRGKAPSYSHAVLEFAVALRRGCALRLPAFPQAPGFYRRAERALFAGRVALFLELLDDSALEYEATG